MVRKGAAMECRDRQWLHVAVNKGVGGPVVGQTEGKMTMSKKIGD